MPAYFNAGSDCEQSSEPHCYVTVHLSDIWPVNNNALGAKDTLADGDHPVVAIGSRLVADGRPLNLTGVVVSYHPGLTVATSTVVVDIATGVIVRQYVANLLTYTSYETTPQVGQAVYVDDSASQGAGVTLTMSPLNSGGLRNPLAGYLWYCQDEMADASVGGARVAHTFDDDLLNSLQEFVYCVLLVNSARELA